jgi:hypothetical protein
MGDQSRFGRPPGPDRHSRKGRIFVLTLLAVALIVPLGVRPYDGVKTGTKPMIKERIAVLIVATLLCIPLCARAQVGTTTQNGVRIGPLGGGSLGAAASRSSTRSTDATSPSGSSPSAPSGNPVFRNSIGTGQNSSGAALGLTP